MNDMYGSSYGKELYRAAESRPAAQVLLINLFNLCLLDDIDMIHVSFIIFILFLYYFIQNSHSTELEI